MLQPGLRNLHLQPPMPLQLGSQCTVVDGGYGHIHVLTPWEVSREHPHGHISEGLDRLVSIVDWHGMQLPPIDRPSEGSASKYIGVVSAHVDLDVLGRDFMSLLVSDVEWDEGSPPVVFKPQGRRQWYTRWSLVVGVWDVDCGDGGSGVDALTWSSLYAHPLGSVGWRKRSGIFVIFLDKAGQSIDQRCGFCMVEVNVDHASGWKGSRSDR